jgi:hypothetical protein
VLFPPEIKAELLSFITLTVSDTQRVVERLCNAVICLKNGWWCGGLVLWCCGVVVL